MPKKRKKVATVPPPPQEKPLFSSDEMDSMVSSALRYGQIAELLRLAKESNISISAHVTRISRQYSHENTVTFEITTDPSDFTDHNGDYPSQAKSEAIHALMTKVETQIDDMVRNISRSIYKSLEKEYEYQFNGEGAEESIRANEYTFDENGHRDESNELQYDQLDDRAKERAKEWFAEGASQEDWSEFMIDNWQQDLVEMGFGGPNDIPDIRFSGFWSQGDGASFECSTVNLDRFLKYLWTGKGRKMGL